MKSNASSTTDLMSLPNLPAATISHLTLEQSAMDYITRQNNRHIPNRMPPGLSVNTSHSQFTLHDNFSQDFLQSADSDTHQFSAGLQPSAGWASFNPAYEIDWMYPSLTNSSSGDENDEQSLHATDLGRSLTGTGPLPSEASDLGEDAYRLSAASSYITLPQGGMVNGNALDIERFIINCNPLPLETAQRDYAKLNLERYLSDPSPQNVNYMDGGLGLALSGDGGYDADPGLFLNPFNFTHQFHESTDNLDVLSSNITSPADSVLLNMATPVSTEDEGLVWMRRFSNASNPAYQPSLDQNWSPQSHAQSQSPR